ncbi:MAG: cytochrome C oxidase assembly protein [Rhodobacteraceae bacterium]|nr:cytochrome C oxidase assembly protein [Paracoccaceae bacterium]
MDIRPDHELHQRRKKSNVMLGLVLGGFVVLVFAITVVKMLGGQNLEAFDHSVRPQLTEASQ